MNRAWQSVAGRSLRCSLRLLTISLFYLLLIQAVAAQDNASGPRSDDTRLIEGLRARRLFDLAELHCRQVLSSPNLTPTEQASFTIELIKTQTARAILSNGPARESAWQSARQTAAMFLSEQKNHPRAFLVQVQAALSHLSRGQLLLQELSAEMVSESARDQALQQLRQARALLGEVQRGIVKAIPEQRGRTLGAHELSVEELVTLNNNVRFQLAIANVKRAMLYTEKDRLNRIDALNNVLERLKEVQGQTSQGQPLWWESQVLQIECFRLLGKIGEAQAALERIRNSVSHDSIPQTFFEQQLRLALDQGDQPAMLSALQATEKPTGRNPQLELARLEVMMHLAARASGDQENKQWLTAASQLTRAIENQHGGYWGRRAELVLIGSAETKSATAKPEVVGPGAGDIPNPPSRNGRPSSAELDLLVRLADNAMRNGRFDDAVKAYDRAAQTARETGATAQAFSLAVQASRALEEQQQYQQAANRLIELANQDTSDVRSSSGHLRGCWNFSQGLGDDPEKQSEFIELLKQHLKQWPQAATANQARLWLAGQQQTRRDWRPAFENYASIDPTSPLFGDAMIRAVYCAQRILDTSTEEERGNFAAQFTDHLQSILDSSEPATSSYQQALLALAEIGTRYGTIDPVQLVEPLESLVASATDSQVQGRGRAWLLAASACDSAKATEAEELLIEIGQDKTLLAIAEQGLATLVRQQPVATADRLNQLRLKVTETALSLSPEKRELTFWLYRKSEALADTQQHEAALTVLLELEQKFPKDAGIQLRIARLLTREFTDREPAKPLAKWRRLAAQLKPHTPNWYEAKFQVASLLEKSGQKNEARKLLEYLKAVPPGWENSTLKGEFDRLLAKCK